jgi:NACalpha-BTF3-like transcription factor
MEELIQLIAKTYGIVGMLLIAPLGAAIVLYLDHRKAQAIHKKEIDEWEAKLAKAQEQRVQDAQAITTKLVEIVSEQTGLSKETNMALERINEVMTTLTQTLQQVLLGINRK